MLRLRLYLGRKVFSRGRLIVLGGQGTQQKGMLDQVKGIPQARNKLQDFSHLLGEDFYEIATTNHQNKLNQTQVTQPILLISHYLHANYVTRFQALPTDTMIGHSVGEFSALALAGSLGIEDALRIVQKRGQLMVQHSGQGENAMLMVRFSDEKAPQVFELISQMENLYIGTHNTSNNLNISGRKDAVSQLRNSLRDKKISSILLPVSTSFHCPLLSGVVAPFRDFLESIEIKSPACRIIRNVDCEDYCRAKDIREGLVRHLTEPVLFWQSVEKWRKENEECFEEDIVEIGHKEFIKKFVKETLKKLK